VTKPVESRGGKGKDATSTASSGKSSTTTTTTTTTVTTANAAGAAHSEAQASTKTLAKQREDLEDDIINAIRTLPTKAALKKVLSYINSVKKEGTDEL